MKTIYASWTYLETIQVEDDITDEEIEELLDNMEPERGTFNERYWGFADGSSKRGE